MRSEVSPVALTADDGPALQELFDEIPNRSDVFVSEGSADAVSTFVALPEGHDYSDKHLIGVWRGGRLTAAADVIANYPQGHSWTIGMLIVGPSARSLGFGRSLLEHIQAQAQVAGARDIRALVNSHNGGGHAFLTHLGYEPVEEPGDPVMSVMRKILRA